MLKRLFPNVLRWPAEKWLALPTVMLIALGVLIGVWGKVFN
jgi:hypothetical protein